MAIGDWRLANDQPSLRLGRRGREGVRFVNSPWPPTGRVDFFLVPKLCLGTHLSAKLCFEFRGRRRSWRARPRPSGLVGVRHGVWSGGLRHRLISNVPSGHVGLTEWGLVGQNVRLIIGLDDNSPVPRLRDWGAIQTNRVPLRDERSARSGIGLCEQNAFLPSLAGLGFFL